MESTWLETGHKIRDLQETLFNNNALPSLKGASDAAIGFISDVPAMGYQTYFVGPVNRDSPDQAHHPNATEMATSMKLTSNASAAGNLRVIEGASMALTLSEATGQPVSLKAGYISGSTYHCATY